MIKANTTCELHIYRCGTSYFVLLFAKRSQFSLTHSLTSELVDSRRLIIVLNRSEALGFVLFEDVNTRFRGDFSIAMTEVLGNGRK